MPTVLTEIGSELSKRSLPQLEQLESSLELPPESRLPTLASGIRYRLLKGDMDNLPAVQSRVMRLYISSNFYGIQLSALRSSSVGNGNH